MFARLLLLLTLSAPPVSAEPFAVRFDMSLRGITGGQLALVAETGGGRYAVTGRAAGTGVVGALVRYAYEGRAEGRLGAAGPLPDSYTEVEIAGRDRSETRTRFAEGRPVAVRIVPMPPPAPWQIAPGAAGRAIDPLTALWDMLRPQAAVCDRSYDLFDGQRVSRLVLAPARPDPQGGTACDARYTRIAGYSPEEMARRDGGRFTVHYQPTGDGRLAAAELRARTSLGVAVLRRR
ncbi:DUF3108 domain-containing protein [Jannaschia ovalis]|uniref:DUF3108 domain-containing protein n=1 Tax=Jannaschia ovalis TaxID=3038773 RepID=A0ABY8LEZ3_9RHOB|nr:DUF3108 domain-containing protein [Jannaschia sp. GRR-S6-38]WGH79872.1 DUF3108 domain-containing protein [Jannaschia sp. GRR-S6-38]